MTVSPSAPASADALAFLHHGGAMGEAIRRFDWRATSLGAPEGWPEALRATLRLVLPSPQPICFWWGPDLVQFHNESYLEALGPQANAALGVPIQTFWREVWDEVGPFVADARAGRGTRRENVALRLRRGDVEEDTFWTFSYGPLRDEAGRVEGILKILTETTGSVRGRQALDDANVALVKANQSLADEFATAQAALTARAEAEKQQSLLQRELSHRMKNTLAMVQAVVTQSLRHATDLKDAAQMASSRIQALGRAQDTLTATDWKTSTAARVVEASIAPHRDDADRFAVDGPPVQLDAQQAMGLALAIHELATNAAKYGALSNAEGVVTISWSVREPNGFRFLWCETGGPPVQAPTRRGFGSRLTERVVPGYFDGSARLDYAPGGFRYTLDGSLAAVHAEPF